MDDIFDQLKPIPKAEADTLPAVSGVSEEFVQDVESLNQNHPDVKFELTIKDKNAKPVQKDAFDLLGPTQDEALKAQKEEEQTIPLEPVDNKPIEQKVYDSKLKKNQLVLDAVNEGVPPGLLGETLAGVGNDIKGTAKGVLLPLAMRAVDLIARTSYAKNAALKTLLDIGKMQGLSAEQVAEQIRQDPVAMALYEKSPAAYTGKIALKNLIAYYTLFKNPGVQQRMAVAAGTELLSGIGDIEGKKTSIDSIFKEMGIEEGIVPGGPVKTLSDALPDIYSASGEEWLKFQKHGLLDPSGRGTLAFAIDVGTDPLTYLSFGGSGAIRLLTKDGKILHLTEAGTAARAARVVENLGTDFADGLGGFKAEQLNPEIRQRLKVINGGQELPEVVTYSDHPELYNAGVNAGHSEANEHLLNSMKTNPELKKDWTKGTGIDLRMPVGDQKYHLADWDQIKTPLQSAGLYAATRFGNVVGMSDARVASELAKAGRQITRANDAMRDFTAKYFKGSLLHNPYVKLNKDAYLDDAVYAKAIADKKIERALAGFYKNLEGLTGRKVDEGVITPTMRVHERQLWEMIQAHLTGADPGFLPDVPYGDTAREIAEIIIKAEDGLKLTKGEPILFNFGFREKPEVIKRVIQDIRQKIAKMDSGYVARNPRDPIARIAARGVLNQLTEDGLNFTDFAAREEIIDASRLLPKQFHLSPNWGLSTGIRNKTGSDALTMGRNMYGQWLVKQFGEPIDTTMGNEMYREWITPVIEEVGQDFSSPLFGAVNSKLNTEISTLIDEFEMDPDKIRDFIENPYKYIKTRVIKGGTSPVELPEVKTTTAEKVVDEPLVTDEDMFEFRGRQAERDRQEILGAIQKIEQDATIPPEEAVARVKQLRDELDNMELHEMNNMPSQSEMNAAEDGPQPPDMEEPPPTPGTTSTRPKPTYEQGEYVEPVKAEAIRKMIFARLLMKAMFNAKDAGEAGVFAAQGRVLDLLDEYPELMQQVKPTVANFPDLNYKNSILADIGIDGKPRKLPVPADVAKDWERITIAARKDPETRKWLQMWDGYSNAWKVTRTAPFPSFSIRNAYENAMVQYLRNGVNAARNRPLAMKLMYLTGEIPGANKLKVPGINSKEVFVTDPGAKYSLGEIASQIEMHGILQSTGNVMETTGNAFPLPGVGAAKAARDTVLLDEKLYRASPRGKAMIKAWEMTKATGRGVKFPFKNLAKAARGMDNYERINMYVNGLRRGLSPTEAAQEVHQFLIDYTKLSEFEQGFMRRVVPFYGFYRLGIPNWTKAAFQEPGRTNVLTYATRDDSRRDDFGRDQDYMASYRINDKRVRLGSDGKTQHVVEGVESPLSPLSIFDPLFTDPNHMTGLLRTLATSSHPGIAEPIKWVTGVDAARGIPVEGVPAQALGEFMRKFRSEAQMRNYPIPFVMKPDPKNPHHTLYELTPAGATIMNVALMSRFITESDTVLKRAEADPKFAGAAAQWLDAFLNSKTMAGIDDKTIDVEEEYNKKLREVEHRLTLLKKSYNPNKK